MAIQAGDIVYDIKGDTKQLQASLTKAKGGLQSLMPSMRQVGVGLTAMGAAGALIGFKLVTGFAKTGDAIQKMALRTGFSTEELSRLSHAANLSGTSLEGMEKGLRNMTMVIGEASKGTTEYQDKISDLGLSWEDLASQTPEEQFNTILVALAGMEDPTMRATAAMDIFGTRIGTQLLPMLANGVAGLEEMKASTKQIFTQEDADKAAAFEDAMENVRDAFGALAMELAPILIDTILPMIDGLVKGAGAAAEWAKENPGLTKTITLLAAGFTALASVLGPFLIVLPGIMAAFSGVTGALAGTAGATAAATGATAAIGGLLAAVLPIAIVLGVAAVAIYKITEATMAWGAANEQLRESEERLRNATDGYTDSLKEKGAILNETALAALDHTEKMAYLADTEKANADSLARAWFEHYAGRVESQEEFARMRALMLNDEIDEQEAAMIVQSNMSLARQEELIKASAEQTAIILDGLGITAQAAKDADMAISESAMSAAQAREQTWVNAHHNIAAAEEEAVRRASSTWEGFKGWLDNFIGSGIAGWRPFGTEEEAEGRASGGRVEKGNRYNIGERGPELFVPDATGKNASVVGAFGKEKDVLAPTSGWILDNPALREIAQLLPDPFTQYNPRGLMDAIMAVTNRASVDDKGVSKHIFSGKDLIVSQLRSIGLRAAGGPVDAGKPYLVGEKGPEMIIPRQPGQVMTAQQTAAMASGGGGSNVTISGPLVQVDRLDATNAADVDNLAIRMGEVLRQQMQATGRQLTTARA